MAPDNKEPLDDQLQTAVVFQTYSVALNLMNKTLLLLAERGADTRTLNFLISSINMLIEKINSYAGELAIDKKWNEDLDQICLRFQIDRAGARQGDLPGFPGDANKS